MCIRDSMLTMNMKVSSRPMSAWNFNSENDQVATPMDSVTAVSYTHLRAHETVLDLVCRLLLEKKKSKLRPPTEGEPEADQLVREETQHTGAAL